MLRFGILLTAAVALLLPSNLFAQSGMPGQSIVRPVGHAAWADYHGAEIHGPGCGCGAPVGPSCGGGCCSPCCPPPLLCIVPNAIRGVGRVLSCILPCNKCCRGGCGFGGCSSCCDAGPSCGCGAGGPTMMHSDPFIDDPMPVPAVPRETRSAPSRYPSYVSPKVATRSTPVRSTAAPQPAARPAATAQPTGKVAAASRPASSYASRIATSEAHGHSVLKPASAESEIAAPRRMVAPPISARRVSGTKSEASLTNFEVPVNPLRK